MSYPSQRMVKFCTVQTAVEVELKGLESGPPLQVEALVKNEMTTADFEGLVFHSPGKMSPHWG